MGDEGEFDIDALLEAPYVKEVKWGGQTFLLRQSMDECINYEGTDRLP